MSAGQVDIGADRFPVAMQGAGPAILFVHGVPGDWRTFAPHAAFLADRYRCVTYTQRWFGTADWRPDGPAFGTAAHADDLVAVAETLGLGPLALVAWSYAAHPALKAAVDRPDLFRALLVYEPGFPTYVSNPQELARFNSDAAAAWAPVVEASETGDTEAMLRALWDASGGPGDFDRLPARMQNQLRDSAAILPRLFDQTPPVPLTCADLNSLQIPATVAWGRKSRLCYTIPSRAAAECIGGDGVQIEDADHLWPMREPEEFARLVDRWHQALPQQAG